MGARGVPARARPREIAALAGLYALVAGAPIPRFLVRPDFLRTGNQIADVSGGMHKRTLQRRLKETGSTSPIHSRRFVPMSPNAMSQRGSCRSRKSRCSWGSRSKRIQPCLPTVPFRTPAG